MRPSSKVDTTYLFGIVLIVNFHRCRYYLIEMNNIGNVRIMSEFSRNSKFAPFTATSINLFEQLARSRMDNSEVKSTGPVNSDDMHELAMLAEDLNEYLDLVERTDSDTSLMSSKPGAPGKNKNSLTWDGSTQRTRGKNRKHKAKVAPDQATRDALYDGLTYKEHIAKQEKINAKFD